MQCYLCPAVEKDPVAAEWLPYFYHGKTEHGPVCSKCAGKYLRVGEDGEYEVKPESVQILVRKWIGITPGKSVYFALLREAVSIGLFPFQFGPGGLTASLSNGLVVKYDPADSKTEPCAEFVYIMRDGQQVAEGIIPGEQVCYFRETINSEEIKFRNHDGLVDFLVGKLS